MPIAHRIDHERDLASLAAGMDLPNTRTRLAIVASEVMTFLRLDRPPAMPELP
jgi:hypothetical protein